jgi:translation initiation factor IF-3
MPFEDAFRMAENRGLDLVEIAGKAEPPVCRIMDYGKFQYQEDKRLKEAKRNQVIQKVKEIKFHLQIDDNDFNLKVKKSIEFLQRGDKVQAVLAFRGREITHVDMGMELMERFKESIGDVAVVAQPPKMVGRSCQMVFAPNTKNKKKTADAKPEGDTPEA